MFSTILMKEISETIQTKWFLIGLQPTLSHTHLIRIKQLLPEQFSAVTEEERTYYFTGAHLKFICGIVQFI